MEDGGREAKWWDIYLYDRKISWRLRYICYVCIIIIVLISAFTSTIPQILYSIYFPSAISVYPLIILVWIDEFIVRLFNSVQLLYLRHCLSIFTVIHQFVCLCIYVDLLYVHVQMKRTGKSIINWYKKLQKIYPERIYENQSLFVYSRETKNLHKWMKTQHNSRQSSPFLIHIFIIWMNAEQGVQLNTLHDVSILLPLHNHEWNMLYIMYSHLHNWPFEREKTAITGQDKDLQKCGNANSKIYCWRRSMFWQWHEWEGVCVDFPFNGPLCLDD